jgi:hypothetical protein
MISCTTIVLDAHHARRQWRSLFHGAYPAAIQYLSDSGISYFMLALLYRLRRGVPRPTLHVFFDITPFLT